MSTVFYLWEGKILEEETIKHIFNEYIQDDYIVMSNNPTKKVKISTFLKIGFYKLPEKPNLKDFLKIDNGTKGYELFFKELKEKGTIN